MTEGRHFENIALVGFMGTGKSTVGQIAASMLNFTFVDTDEMIERMAHKRISDIFASDGEARFREHEREVVSQLKGMKHAVISTGGGLITNPENLASLRERDEPLLETAKPRALRTSAPVAGKRKKK